MSSSREQGIPTCPKPPPSTSTADPRVWTRQQVAQALLSLTAQPSLYPLTTHTHPFPVTFARNSDDSFLNAPSQLSQTPETTLHYSLAMDSTMARAAKMPARPWPLRKRVL